MANTSPQVEKAIIRKDKETNELVVFWLETPANRGNLWSNGISGAMVWSGSEASVDYYYSNTVKPTKKEITQAKKAILAVCEVKIDAKSNLLIRYLDKVWSK